MEILREPSVSEVPTREAGAAAEIKKFIQDMQGLRDFQPKPLVFWPDPSIKKGCTKKYFDMFAPRYAIKEYADLLFEMTGTMFYYNGVGLAANQIGSPFRCFVAIDPEDRKTPRYYIEPEIVDRMRNGFQYNVEGCLSLPGVEGTIGRYKNIKLAYKDEHGVNQVKEFEGFGAQVIQHEMDHLDGTCLLNKMNMVDKAANKRIIEALKLIHEGKLGN
jgi:peptide deformylase